MGQKRQRKKKQVQKALGFGDKVRVICLVGRKRNTNTNFFRHTPENHPGGKSRLQQIAVVILVIYRQLKNNNKPTYNKHDNRG